VGDASDVLYGLAGHSSGHRTVEGRNGVVVEGVSKRESAGFDARDVGNQRPRLGIG
jgi:hypothetical protein